MSNERERIKYARKQFCAKGREKGTRSKSTQSNLRTAYRSWVRVSGNSNSKILINKKYSKNL